MKSAFFSLVTVVGYRHEKVAYFLSPHSKKRDFRCHRRRMRSRARFSLYSKPLATLATDGIADDLYKNIHAPSLFHEKSRQLAAASTLSLAPMMDYTDRHFRRLVRLVSSNTLLYTEMITANAIVQQYQKYMVDADPSKNSSSYLQRLIGQGRVDPLEGPCVLQLGGSDPAMLEKATAIVLEHSYFGGQHKESGFCDYTAINLNCGCPSPKVAGSGCFGAALMSEPHLVKDCVLAMSQGCHSIFPITVKCRIGTDEDSPFQKNSMEALETKKQTYDKLCHFIDVVSSSGVVTDFQIHARIAVLDKNFSPADNRNIPPLQYDLVYQLVQDFPHLSFSLNGGVESLQSAQNHLNTCQGLKGVMVGRAWVSNPWGFAMADTLLYHDKTTTVSNDNYFKPQNRLEVLKAYGLHADAEEREMDPIKIRRPILKAITNLFAGEKNARKYRIALDDLASGRTNHKNQNEPLLSDLILNIALECLGEDALLQSRHEPYCK